MNFMTRFSCTAIPLLRRSICRGPSTRPSGQIIHYTGYVDEEAGAPEQVNRAGIVVSGGSSAASLPLYRAALEAARIVTHKDWHILIGRGIDDVAFEALARAAPAHAKVERARPDFRRLLAARRIVDQPSRIQHLRRSSAIRSARHSGAIRAGPRNRAAPARRKPATERPRTDPARNAPDRPRTCGFGRLCVGRAAPIRIRAWR